MSEDPLARFGVVPLFVLGSTDVVDGGPLKVAQYSKGLGGEDRSPQLAWSGFPAATRSFALTVYDPDAPTGSGWWHWAVADLPVSVTTLDAGAGDPRSPLLPKGALTLPNESRQARYLGAAPPSGTGVHRYQFIVHALDVPSLGLDPDSTPAILGINAHFHVLGRAVLTGTGQASR